jgi:hypothetical protein
VSESSNRLEGEKLSEWLYRVLDNPLPRNSFIAHARRLENRIISLEDTLEDLNKAWLQYLLGNIKTQEIWLSAAVERVKAALRHHDGEGKHD